MHPGRRQTLRSTLYQLIEPVVAQLGYELVAIELTSGPRSQILRVYIDHPAGVGIGDCKRTSRALGPELDVADPITSAYKLEVSSPGIDRPVERDQDFERFKGFRAKVRMLPGHGRKRYTGVLDGLEDGQVKLLVGEQLVLLPRDEVDMIRLDLDLEEFQRLGAPSNGGAVKETS